MTRIGPHLRDRIVEALEKPHDIAAVAKQFGVAEITVERLARANRIFKRGRVFR